MKVAIAVEDALGRLAERAGVCCGAVFLTYTFDARFFEEEILATVLQLQEDPTDATLRFLEEGRRKLVEAPVMVIADPGMLRGGQRLPYDMLRADATRLFHPKLALILYNDGAVLTVGSGNLTQGGYGGNTELSALLRLDYSEDAGLLRQTIRFIEACGARGEAWTRFMAELRPRLAPGAASGSSTPWLLHTYDEKPLIDLFLDRLPPDAKVDRIGILAPFHQQDGAPPDAAVLDRLLDATEGRRGRNFVLDVGVSWEGNSVAYGLIEKVDPLEYLGKLWGKIDGAPGKETASWFVPSGRVGRYIESNDGRVTNRITIRAFLDMVSKQTVWPVQTVEAVAPADLIERAAARTALRVWLYPEIHRREGRTYRQPLHAKLIAAVVREGQKKRTHILIGSPNASAAALLRADGNIECALHLVLEGNHDLGSMCGDLVCVPRELVTMRGRSFAALPPSPSRWIQDAFYDARRRMVQVVWLENCPDLLLVYPSSERRIMLDGIPAGTSQFDDFDLDPACCELEISDTPGVAARVPLRIESAVDLPVSGVAGDLDLQELLLIHAGRYTPAGIKNRRSAFPSGGDDGAGEDPIFGAALGPREIFRALLSIGSELERAPSLGAFQALLQGPWGVRRLAQRIVEAPHARKLMETEAWIYGAELARILSRLRFDGDPTHVDKAALRNEVVHWISENLKKPSSAIPGLPDLIDFYEGAS